MLVLVCGSRNRLLDMRGVFFVGRWVTVLIALHTEAFLFVNIYK